MRRGRLVAAANITIRVLRAGNLLLLLAFLVMLFLSVVFYTELAAQIGLRHPSRDADVAILGMRLMVVVGIIWTAVNEWFLRALLQITCSASDGDPFVATNVSRLRTIGWALIAMQILAVWLGLLENRFEIGVDNHWQPSVSGWLAVLMVFVLAEVFAVGAAMREEQQGTV